MKVEYPSLTDLYDISSLDRSIDSSILKDKIQRHEILVARDGNKIVGLLRYSLFWDNTPFMNLLLVEEDRRKEGIGSKLVRHWELMMKEGGFEIVMTSSQSDETAQDFYRKLKYREVGSFEFPGQKAELIFLKELKFPQDAAGNGS